MTGLTRLHRCIAAVAVTAALSLAACGGGDAGPAGQPTPSGDDRVAASSLGRITVLAASSLTGAFTELGARLENEHPGTRVAFSFAASSELASQVLAGAPADVFASASVPTMALVADSGGIGGTGGEPVTFATNTLEIAVPAGNPGKVSALADFARPELTIGLCAPEVPCGSAAATVLGEATVDADPDTLEADVKALLSKVILGEIDAALVYRTDVLAAGEKVTGIDFPQASTAVNAYPVAVLRDAPNPEGGQAFVDLLLSAEGAEVLAAAGFGPP